MDKTYSRENLPFFEVDPQTLPSSFALSEMRGRVFNIQKFTVHDGPGIRTGVFLKGCSLRCRWCSNPESFALKPQVGVYKTKCIGVGKCGLCFAVCPKAAEGALLEEEGVVTAINRELCDDCLKCYEVCPSDALKIWGREMSVDEVVQTVAADINYYRQSGGGVTISGGEVLCQWQFTQAILQSCRQMGIHCCVESALHAPPEALDAIVPYTDLFITDIKHADSAAHKLYTGVGNARILANIKRLAASGMPFVIRLPIIPGVNDSVEHIQAVGDFILHELGNKAVQVQFLRFRRLGEEKYTSLGLPYQMAEVSPERSDFERRIRQLVSLLACRGIPAVAGTTHKIIM